MTRVNKQITQTSQENIDSSEKIKRNDEFSIHTKVTSEQASKQEDRQEGGKTAICTAKSRTRDTRKATRRHRFYGRHHGKGK
jgi:hypothetical protein